ncbi:capsule assembly Wzi family protein [Runella sp. SP2]|uniref:capsule assembly Wzi family protein n=1 Tax=Runella sp. SP2 TaxID=2268026 RepID=UPI000F07908B|nr:capsule assembly Wzi family protein [Runella sp. SP2]AYQ30778.1 hypothetical protein DTQ70_00655 [Runella sp. SP2]
MFRYIYLLLFTCSLANIGFSKALFHNDTTKKHSASAFVEMGGIITPQTQTPFWLRVNKNGTVPSDSPLGFVNLEANWIRNGKIRWIGQISTSVVQNKNSSIYIPNLHIDAEYKGLVFRVGRFREIIGLGDSSMSSGFYIYSGNALPIPKIQLSTNGFLPLHFTNGFLSIHAQIGHGWFGHETWAQNYYLHQKSFYLKFGKPRSSIHLYTGISHFAQWGGNSAILIGSGRVAPNGDLPHSLKDFLYVISAQKFPQSTGLSSFDTENRVGNHLGTLEALFEYQNLRSTWLAYYQHPIENMPGVFGNFPDGLYGISWRNKSPKTSKLAVTNFIIEYLTTLDQGLFYNSIINTYHGNDYFNNSQYMDGWTYRNHIIGTPFITYRNDTRPEWVNLRGSYEEGGYMKINSNSVTALHVSSQVSFGKKNTILFRVSPSRHYFNLRNDGSYEKNVNQFSSLLEFQNQPQKHKDIVLKMALSFDDGELLPNTFGASFSFRKYISK